MLGWLVEEKRIAPHIPVWDKTQRDDEMLSSSDFRWDEQADEYRCPQGHVLRRQWRAFKHLRTHIITKADTIIYRSSQADCATCSMKARCCPNTPIRKIARSVHESARDVARDIAKTGGYKQSRKDRKKVEMLFAHLKQLVPLLPFASRQSGRSIAGSGARTRASATRSKARQDNPLECLVRVARTHKYVFRCCVRLGRRSTTHQPCPLRRATSLQVRPPFRRDACHPDLRHDMTRPPATSRVAPVIQEEAEDRRKRVAAATSRG
jgi:DDE family transposase